MPLGGWPSSNNWPYYNLQWAGEGLIIVVGWPGQWVSNFSRDKGDGLHITAGQETTHFKLLPGEEVRSPLMALQFWKGGDWIRAQNIWRRWLIAHNMPRPGGKLPPPLLSAGSSGQFNEMTEANEDNQKLFIDRYLDHGVKIDFWWMDAGWYENKTGWPNVGTWEVDRKRFPHGLRAVTDHAHARGVNALLWFEPERVTPGTWLYENKRSWLLGRDGGQKLLYYGIPAARHWMANHVLKLMKDEGIDIYRQDFNFPPLHYWRRNDTPDRKGITEIRHCVGYLAYWDEFRRGNPNMLTDDAPRADAAMIWSRCACAVPLHKSDMNYGDLEAKHTQFYGLSLWHPYFATGTGRVDSYARANRFCPAAGPWLRRSPRRPGLCPGPQVRRRMEGSRPELLRRFLPLNALELRAGHMDGLAVRPSGGRPGSGPGVPQAAELSHGGSIQAARTRSRSNLRGEEFRRYRHERNQRTRTAGSGFLRGRQRLPRGSSDYVQEEIALGILSPLAPYFSWFASHPPIGQSRIEPAKNTGWDEERSICTSHVERHNLTIRS